MRPSAIINLTVRWQTCKCSAVSFRDAQRRPPLTVDKRSRATFFGDAATNNPQVRELPRRGLLPTCSPSPDVSGDGC